MFTAPVTMFLIVYLYVYALLVLSEFIRKGKNRTKERAVIAEEVREQSGPTTIRTHERSFLAEEIKEQFKYKVTEVVLNCSSCNTLSLSLFLLILCFYKLL